jgi:hypothetical protein
MLDLCVLYADNRELVSKMLANVFSAQPLYEQDLVDAVKCEFILFDCHALFFLFVLYMYVCFSSRI